MGSAATLLLLRYCHLGTSLTFLQASHTYRDATHLISCVGYYTTYKGILNTNNAIYPDSHVLDSIRFYPVLSGFGYSSSSNVRFASTEKGFAARASSERLCSS